MEKIKYIIYLKQTETRPIKLVDFLFATTSDEYSIGFDVDGN